MQGRVLCYYPDKHFGFIWTEAGDFYFTKRNVIGEPVTRAMDVEFWLDDGRRGDLVAVDVKRISQRPQSQSGLG